MGRQRALRRAAMTGGALERHLQALGAAAIEMGQSAPFLHQVGGAWRRGGAYGEAVFSNGGRSQERGRGLGEIHSMGGGRGLKKGGA